MRLAPLFIIGLLCAAAGCATTPISSVPSPSAINPPPPVQEPHNAPPENTPFATVGDQKISKQHLCLLMLWPLKTGTSRGTPEEYWAKLQHWKQRLVEDALLANQMPAWNNELQSSFQKEQATKWGAILVDDPVFSSKNPSFWDQAEKTKKACNVDDSAWQTIQKRTWLATQALASLPAPGKRILDNNAAQYYRDLFSSVNLRYVRVQVPMKKAADLSRRMTTAHLPWTLNKNEILPGTPHYWGNLTISGRDRMAAAFYDSQMQLPHDLILAALTAKPNSLLGPFSLGSKTLYAVVDKRNLWKGKPTTQQIEWYASLMRQEQARANIHGLCTGLLKSGSISTDDAFLTNHFYSVFKGINTSNRKHSNPCGDK